MFNKSLRPFVSMLLPIILISCHPAQRAANSSATSARPPQDNYGTPVVPQQIANNIAEPVKNTIKDVGEIGDVKYSVLSFIDFQKENGEGWVLLAGQEIDSHWAIYTYRGIFTNNKLPDAQGVFLRGMMVETNRTDGNSGNPESQSLGEYHLDAVGKINDTKIIFQNGTVGSAGNGLSVLRKDNPFDQNTTTKTIQIPTGTETRPKNITLYIYIKVYHAKPLENK